MRISVTLILPKLRIAMGECCGDWEPARAEDYSSFLRPQDTQPDGQDKEALDA